LKIRQVRIPLYVCLQKVEWATLMYYVGILSGVSALGYVGWLGYLQQAYESHDATWVNVIIGVVSCCIDNNVLEAAVLEAKPLMGIDQWSLNMLLIAIGGSLTVVGSAPGVIAMTIDKSYTFSAHTKFLPAIIVNFVCTILIWYIQYEVLSNWFSLNKA
jgi:Na+/H+ antiporter NhaD/arsenite permease-like protein